MSTGGKGIRELTQKEQDLRRIEQFRLMDDDFFSEALDEKNEAVGFILNTILERDDLVVTSTKAEDMYSSVLADEVRYLKETEGGRSQMCKAMEEMRMEAAEAAVHRDRIENALKMIASGRLTNQEIADWTGLALSEVEELAGQKTA